MIGSFRRALWWAILVAAGAGIADAFGWVSNSVAIAGGGVGVAVALLSGGLSALAAMNQPPAGKGLSGDNVDGWSAEGRPFDDAMPPHQLPAVVPELVEKAERLAVLAQATAGDVHFRLRPVLRDIAADLLANRLAIELDRDDRAEAVLGPELWEVVRPGRPAPENRHAPGLSSEGLESFIARLESIR